MPLSDVERARRSRAHKRGDHALCPPERRCALVEQTQTCEAVASAQALPDDGYGPRGAAFREAMTDHDPGPLHRLLVDEIARILDRLDRLNGALERKDTWLRFGTGDGGAVAVTVDGVLVEARLQAASLKALVAELRAALPKPAAKPTRTPPAQRQQLGDLVRRAAQGRPGGLGYQDAPR